MTGVDRLATLVERAQSGDVDAFETLYRTTVGRVYALCLRMCRDPHLAEELVQESYVRAWQKLATFRRDSLFTTWMHRLATNVVLGHFRRAGRRIDELDDDGERLAGEPAADRPSELALDLERAIASLPAGARNVLVLHDVEGFTHEEIARMSGFAPGTSKAQLSRARRLLRKVLKP